LLPAIITDLELSAGEQGAGAEWQAINGKSQAKLTQKSTRLFLCKYGEQLGIIRDEM
jgi:hypothetical protein